jgi:serine/threonine protein kinase
MIERNDLQVFEMVGEGASAKVYRGKYHNHEVAIKVLKDKMPPKEVEDFKKEFQILTTLKSPHVVFFYGMCIDFGPVPTSPSSSPAPSPSSPATDQPSFVLEWCPGGSLHSLMQRPDEVIGWERFFVFVRDITNAVSTLHNWKPPIVHRDLKSQNLLVTNSGLKVCDFGLARNTAIANSTLRQIRGTFQFMAPEVYNGMTCSTKADIYSAGMILWELIARVITGKYVQPYSEFPNIFADFIIIIQVAKNDLRPTIPPQTPAGLAEVVKKSWSGEPDTRPSIDELRDLIDAQHAEYLKNKAAWDAVVTRAASD